MSRRRGAPATGGRTARPEKKASKEFCPLARCVWTAPDGVCRWPGNNCPRRQERLAAERRIQAVRQAARRMTGLRQLAETLKGEERIARIAEVRAAGILPAVETGEGRPAAGRPGRGETSCGGRTSSPKGR